MVSEFQVGDTVQVMISIDEVPVGTMGTISKVTEGVNNVLTWYTMVEFPEIDFDASKLRLVHRTYTLVNPIPTKKKLTNLDIHRRVSEARDDWLRKIFN